jgi:hypothetical protein
MLRSLDREDPIYLCTCAPIHGFNVLLSIHIVFYSMGG